VHHNQELTHLARILLPSFIPKNAIEEKIMQQDQLAEIIQEEIKLMREILSNLLQEEVVLLQQDRNSWQYLMQKRFSILQKISQLREKRSNCNLDTCAPLDQALDISILADQLIVLVDKANKQNMRNQTIMEGSQHSIAIPKTMAYPLSKGKKAESKPLLLTTLLDEYQ
jgi:flagellar biosynthesis/type III secretory pathway chaperone